MINYYVITLGNVKCTFRLDSKRHMWEVFFADLIMRDTEPDLEFTQAKGGAIVKFLREFEKRYLLK